MIIKNSNNYWGLVNLPDIIKARSPLIIALMLKSHPIYIEDLIDAGAELDLELCNRTRIFRNCENNEGNHADKKLKSQCNTV